MLIKLFVLLWSAYAIRSEDAAVNDVFNTLPSEPELRRLIPGYLNENIDSKVQLGTKYELCPASEILIHIQEILQNFLHEDHEIFRESSNSNEVNIQKDDALKTNSQTRENYDEFESLVIPVPEELKTKLTVKYELPGMKDVNCKQALSKILKILKKANLYGNKNILSSTINHGNNNAPNTLFTLLNNQKSHTSPQDIDNILENQASKELSDNILSIPKDYGGTEQINNVGEDEKPQLDQKFQIDKLINSNSRPDNDLSFKLSEWYKVFNNTESNALNEQETVDMNQILNKFTMDNNAKIQNQYNVASSAENLLNIYLKNHSKNSFSYALPPLQPDNNKNKIFNYLMQTAAQNMRYPYLQAYNINPNLNPLNQNTYHYPSKASTNNVYQPPYNTGNNKYYENNGNTQPTYGNVNFVNKNSNHANIVSNGKSVYQASYSNANPYAVSKLIDYENNVNQQLHAPNNLANLQWMIGVSNFDKLNSAPDSSDIVELTYVLKQPNSVAYQPTYFVKYRLPYESFISNSWDLLRRKPHLRTEPAKLYQELINASNIAEVSPNLKGVGRQEIVNLVTNKGALLKAEVKKVDAALLDKQLKTIRNLNSKLTPTEIVNNSYTIEPTSVLDIKSHYLTTEITQKKSLNGKKPDKTDKNLNYENYGNPFY